MTTTTHLIDPAQKAAEHTPTPWMIDPKRKWRVTSLGDYTIAGTGNDAVIRDQWENNAAFIVQACNAYAPLVAREAELVKQSFDQFNEIMKRGAEIIGLQSSLQEMIEVYWGNGDGIEPEPKCIQRAKAALNKDA